MITETDLNEAMRAQARAHPDRTYVPDFRPGAIACNYRPNERNACGCIVGESLVALGVPVSAVAALDSQNAGSWGVSTTFWSVLGEYLTSGALHSVWVGYVQQYQDEGLCWRQAVERADELVAELAARQERS